MKRKITTLLCFSITSIALAHKPPDSVKEAGELYLKSFNREIKTDNDQVIDPKKEYYISWHENLFLYPKQNATDLKLTFRTRELLVKVLSRQVEPVLHPVRTSTNILEDSRVLGSRIQGKSSMPDHLFPGQTIAGEVLKALMLAQPTSDQKELHRRQSLIKTMIKEESLHQKIPPVLDEMKKAEPTVVSLFDEEDFINIPQIRVVLDYQGREASLKEKVSSIALTGVSAVHRVMYWAIIPATLSNFFRVKHCCSSQFLGWAAYTLFLLGANVTLSIAEQIIDSMFMEAQIVQYKAMRARIDTLSHYLQQALSLQQIPNLPEDLTLKFDAQEEALIKAFLHGAQRLIAVDPDASGKHFNYAAKILWYTRELKQTIAKTLYRSAEIDMYLAIAGKMKNMPPDGGQLTFAKFKGSGPHITARGLWNPALDSQSAVTNDITLKASDVCLPRFNPATFTDDTSPRSPKPGYKNLLLSGCNASGKSTLMRAITVNSIYLAQVYGVASADSFQTSLFHSIHSQMDKQDRAGQFSSYEGELKDAMEIFSKANALGAHENMLVCFDELFSNTDPDESLYVTNKVLSAMAKQLRTINIVSSHYDINSADNAIANTDEFARIHMQMQEANKTLVKTYKLRHGHNQQTNGLYHLLEKFRLFPDIYSELETLIEESNNNE